MKTLLAVAAFLSLASVVRADSFTAFGPGGFYFGSSSTTGNYTTGQVIGPRGTYFGSSYTTGNSTSGQVIGPGGAYFGSSYTTGNFTSGQVFGPGGYYQQFNVYQTPPRTQHYVSPQPIYTPPLLPSHTHRRVR